MSLQWTAVIVRNFTNRRVAFTDRAQTVLPNGMVDMREERRQIDVALVVREGKPWAECDSPGLSRCCGTEVARRQQEDCEELMHVGWIFAPREMLMMMLRY